MARYIDADKLTDLKSNEIPKFCPECGVNLEGGMKNDL